MQVLKFDTTDFVFTVECVNIEFSYAKAKKKQVSLNSDSSYSWSPEEGELKLYNPDTNEHIHVKQRDATNPVFFENKEYVFDVEFKHPIEKPRVYSRTKEISDKFYYRENRNVLAGTINFGNDIGKSDFIVDYLKEGKLNQFVFHFEVFPTKLDFKKDYHQILKDIEREYPFLVLDYLKKTYTAFKTGSKEKSDLIWWQIFGGLFEEFIAASEYVLNKPNARLLNETRYLKADRLKKINVGLEQEIARNRHIPNKIYKVEERILSVDTIENRFFKHTVFIITTKFVRIKEYLFNKYKVQISDSFRDILNAIEKKLRSIQHAQFFKGIGQFNGLRQESLVLEKATGYATIYKDWIMLNRGIDFLEGVQKIDLKNIADLYQIWCFLEMKNLLKEILNKENPDEVDLAKIQVDDFTFNIARGAKSRILFKKDNGDVVELFHDFQYDKNATIHNRSYTVNQRPDLVLKLSKSDLRDNFYFTYLYDAKYRLQSDDDIDKPDIPPDDAINQMHRYRDAIYYKNPAKQRPEKEVIGGYILFPGTGSTETVKKSNYYKSIGEVNIGAFPLKPNNGTNRLLLKNHLETILSYDSDVILKEVSHHKDFDYEVFDPEVLIGIVNSEDQMRYLREDENVVYHTRLKPQKINISKLKYFAAYFKEKGIKYYFRIDYADRIPRSEIFPSTHALFSDVTDEYWVFGLSSRKELPLYYKLEDGSITVLRYSLLSYIRKPVDGKIKTI